MITHTNQDWTVGATVKVGFLSLVVKAAIATPGDFKPNAYLLTNAAGTQLYRFVPHNGIEKITPIGATALLAEQEEAAARAAFRAMQQAKQRAAAVVTINELLAA